MIDAGAFQSLRSHLFSVAYRMLGSASEAEDVVQDAWLRASGAPDAPDSARAWLTTVVTRLCLDRLKSAKSRREEYVGPWLPEPVPTDAVDTAEDVAARHESVTMAFLVLLETLTPAERAAFLLREVFDSDYADVAKTLDTTPAAARQLVHRAKDRIAEGRPRFDVEPERRQEIVERFFEAIDEGNLARLEQYLAADVQFIADGGGKASAARRPIYGAAEVGRLMLGFWRGAPSIDAAPGAWTRQLSHINGEPALIVHHRDELVTVFVCSTDGERITAIRAIRNPDKLRWLSERRTL
jgi:RNA polymerase sigma-70 factor (TIGR02957 family)